jgi:hypothetical protein
MPEDLRPVGYGLLCRWPDEQETEVQPSNVIDFAAWKASRQQIPIEETLTDGSV